MGSSYLQELILKEYTRQQNSLELIASENYTSKEVISAYSNIFTNKYSEGYPGKRYYGGNEVVDELELYTQGLALDIFGLDHALRGVNVQPLSGSVANLAVYTGLLNPGDTILAMDLNAGGHLTHGMKLNASGKYFTIVHYGTNKEGVIDYDQLHALTIQHQPKIIVAGFSSYPRNIDWEKFIECKKILAIKGISCYLMADIAHIAGLIAGGTLSSPFEAGFDIITTTTHKTLRGPRGALIYYSLKEGKELELQINRGVFPGVQGGPFDHVLVAKAQAFSEIIDPSTKRSEYSKKTLSHAKLLAQELLNRGWVLTTGGTDNHLMVIDITMNKGKETGLTGKSAEKKLEYIGLSVNKQLLPHDTRPPQDPSGIRVGTPAITTRGLNTDDVKLIANIIHDCLLNLRDEQILRNEVLQLCKQYPLYKGMYGE